MRIGCATESGFFFLTEKDMPELLKFKKCGYDTLDYNGLCSLDHPAYRGGEEELLTIRRNIEAAGLRVHQTHAPFDFSEVESTPEGREARFEQKSAALRATALLGAKYMVMHPLLPFAHEDPDPAFSYAINLEFLTNLTRVAESCGVVICLENLPCRRITLSPPEKTLKLIREVDSPYLKMCLDTGHCSRLGFSPAEAARRIGKEDLAVLHVHDNDGKEDRHWYPGTGVIDWRDFIAALREIGFEGVFNLEPGDGQVEHYSPELREYLEIGYARAAKEWTEIGL